MPKTPNNGELHLKNQQLTNLFHRLKIALKTKTYSAISKEANISIDSIRAYAVQRTYPDIIRLAAIADTTGFSVRWLLFGDEVEPTNEKSCRLIIKDDVMSPKIQKGTQIEYEKLSLPKGSIFNDGLYVIAAPQGNIARRLQWQHTENEYVVFGDNAVYPKQRVKDVNVIGIVTAIFTPL
ncbi:hypothetical protein TUM4438_39580 [Shewanella sairae]|uniref:Uncharacterized protein n=1 Tax=Shewanella sairae TaxID=190310 RepID=A0ABQ4PQ42_9GAMM|nr:S24/S26 family peptidase [Shewanella sairae]MCL1132080.1 S24/S26 family peptidase [Shewanella sairae]GIU51118.1 hypothetical protein TUM4438_39580 [Shewanella sairae]